MAAVTAVTAVSVVVMVAVVEVAAVMVAAVMKVEVMVMVMRARVVREHERSLHHTSGWRWRVAWGDASRWRRVLTPTACS